MGRQRIKPMTVKQAAVMKVIRAGGYLVANAMGKDRYRVVDFKKSPVCTIQCRTFIALSSSGRIIKTQDGTWIRKPLKTTKK